MSDDPKGPWEHRVIPTPDGPMFKIEENPLDGWSPMMQGLGNRGPIQPNPSIEAMMASSRAKVEPGQVARSAARAMFELFTAFTDEGFTERQALTMLGIMLKNADDDDDGG